MQIANAEEMAAFLKSAIQNSSGTQRDLARHLGCSQQYVSLMLNGRSGISLAFLFGILEYAGLELVVMERIVTVKGLNGKDRDH